VEFAITGGSSDGRLFLAGNEALVEVGSGEEISYRMIHIHRYAQLVVMPDAVEG
jgi:hypothetical protein